MTATGAGLQWKVTDPSAIQLALFFVYVLGLFLYSEVKSRCQMKLISLWSGIVNKATIGSSLRDANFTYYV